jgi:hypothetical protein
MPEVSTTLAGVRAIVTQLRALPTLGAASDAQRATMASLKDDCDTLIDAGEAVSEALAHMSAALGRLLNGTDPSNGPAYLPDGGRSVTPTISTCSTSTSTPL